MSHLLNPYIALCRAARLDRQARPIDDPMAHYTPEQDAMNPEQRMADTETVRYWYNNLRGVDGIRGR